MVRYMFFLLFFLTVQGIHLYILYYYFLTIVCCRYNYLNSWSVYGIFIVRNVDKFCISYILFYKFLDLQLHSVYFTGIL